jgi:hypothetical protein
MVINEVGRYKLMFDATALTVRCPKGTAKFSGQATSKLPKLYIASSMGRPVYVGITKQSMRSRLRLGWTADGASGYYGYAWRHGLTEADLDVWCQTDPPVENSCVDLETVEAEIVYLIRKSGQWPPFQTEIHFHQSNAEHRRVAEAIGAKFGLMP